MPRRSFLPRRAPREWAIRGGLAAAAVVASYFSVAHTLAQVLVKSNAAAAHRIAPWDGRITAAFAASLTGPQATSADRQRADALARQALQQDPTAVVAVSTLGIDAQFRNDVAGARRIFAYSERLSRRDLQTQLWNIEAAVSRGDIRGALHHYDIALRAKGQSWDLLFPILTSASADAEVRGPLIETLARKPLWADSFVSYVTANPPDARTTSALFLELGRAGVPVPVNAHAVAINALLVDGLPDEAWRHYAAIHRDADQHRSRDPRFGGAGDRPTPFDWVPVNDGGVSTSIQRGERDGFFDFAAPASTGGPMLQQVQMLPPGTYRLSGHSSGIEQASVSLPYWRLLCRSDGRELARVPMPNSAQSGGNFAGDMSVPAGCPVQVLEFVARASDAVTGMNGQLDRVQLAPVP